MAFDCNEWLNRMVPVRQDFGPDIEMPMHERLCFLVVANGGFDVHGWGYISYCHGQHQRGLEQHDALCLIHLGSYVNGLADAGVPIMEAFKVHFDAYMAALEAKQAELKEKIK